MAPATTYDYVIRKLGTQEQQQAFLSNPNSLHDYYHFTPTDVHEVYGAIDPLKNPKLSQEGKVVLITGANRGIGRVSAVPTFVGERLRSWTYYLTKPLF